MSHQVSICDDWRWYREKTHHHPIIKIPYFSNISSSNYHLYQSFITSTGHFFPRLIFSAQAARGPTAAVALGPRCRWRRRWRRSAAGISPAASPPGVASNGIRGYHRFFLGTTHWEINDIYIYIIYNLYIYYMICIYNIIKCKMYIYIYTFFQVKLYMKI